MIPNKFTPLPPIDEDKRLYGHSGYTGPNARELARRARLSRDVLVTEENFLTICDRMIEGEPLIRICADPTLPCIPHVMRYIHNNEKARDTYYSARETQAETLQEEAMLIALDDSNDFSVDDRGKRISHNDVVQRARVKIDQLNRTAAKLAPKRFGDKNITEIQGSSDKPVTLQVITGVTRSENSLIPGVAAPKIIEGTAVKGIKDAD